MKKRGFTLIELVAVLVIMTIIALIVTQLVMNIIKRARISADKRSIDAYGRSIELAIAGYLMDTGTFPTQISQLTIEYSGSEVVCSTTQLKEDGSVYLAECTVGGRTVSGYTYGKSGGETPSESYTAYSVGDEVSYNNIDYFVIEDSDSTESTVKLLKAEPLTINEVNTYGGVETANNHVNMYNASSSDSWYRTAYNDNGYGGMAYYSSATCGYNGSDWVYDGCTTDYAQSEIKFVVDAWKTAQAPAATEARLITIDEVSSLGYEWGSWGVSNEGWVKTEDTPTWLYNSNSWYWTMSPDNDSVSSVLIIYSDGSLNSYGVFFRDVVRPVIVLSKSLLNS